MTTKALKTLMAEAEFWPPEDQDELASYARVIEARRSGHYRATDSERLAVTEGLEQAVRGEFVSDASVVLVRRPDAER